MAKKHITKNYLEDTVDIKRYRYLDKSMLIPEAEIYLMIALLLVSYILSDILLTTFRYVEHIALFHKILFVLEKGLYSVAVTGVVLLFRYLARRYFKKKPDDFYENMEADEFKLSVLESDLNQTDAKVYKLEITNLMNEQIAINVVYKFYTKNIIPLYRFNGDYILKPNGKKNIQIAIPMATCEAEKIEYYEFINAEMYYIRNR